MDHQKEKPVKKISIEHFGPVENVTLTLDRPLQILIGPQASGKSTIGKAIYFCRKIRDYLVDFASSVWDGSVSGNLYDAFIKYLRNPFMGCFGTTKHMESFVICYVYSEGTGKKLTISLGENKYVRFDFSLPLQQRIKTLLENAGEIAAKRSWEFSTDFQEQQNYLSLFKRNACELFEDDATLLFIPAGRNLLATIPDIILPENAYSRGALDQYDITQIDLFTQSFILYIKRMRNRFGTRLEEIAKNYSMMVKGELQYQDVELACELIKKILKAEYVYDREGEKLYYSKDRWIKLMFGSSGQQEVLWSLNCLYLAILQHEKTFFVYEEPESHIFPDSQALIMQLAALVINSTGSELFLTTHSPYMLTATNLLMYSGKIEQGNSAPVVRQKFRLRPNAVNAYMLLGPGCGIKHILLEGSGLIDAVEIDRISDQINCQMDQIMELEISREEEAK